ncbi:MAG: bacillithiol biosynthesis cysteine-adding enzyme BshC [Chitinophagaceae bacterium]|nr:bacillithiol biosynthesis cysteine-adding enzyme BshC [Chitinophagaceae bacterium]
MKKSVLPYVATGYFSTAVADYIEGNDKLKQFYEYSPQPDSFLQIINRRKEFPLHRETLHGVLSKQYQPFLNNNEPDKVSTNINRLKDSNTFTVVTAHQPNLFLGPLYLVYKIISTINLSRKLSEKFPDFHFVPVYWMGSEDHDKEELNHVQLFSKKITWHTDQEGAFGRMKTESLSGLIEEIKLVLGTSDDAIRCVKLLEDFYLKEQTIAAATKKILYHFFAGDGLVIVDGDDAALKRLFVPVIKKELLEQFSLPVVNESSEAFSENYQSQIMPREINLFYLDDGIRKRIIKEGELWKVLNTTLTFSKDEILKLLETHPQKFSPNVVLRPVYQELVLPNIVFIGGGAEVTYWMQLKSLFDTAGVAYPMLLLRNSVLWIDSGNVSKMKKLNLSGKSIFESSDKLVNQYLAEQTGDLFSLEKEKLELKDLMNSIMHRISQIDAGLKGSVEAEKVKMQKSLESLEDKLRKAAKKKEEVAIQQLQTLKEKLFPANGLQERYENFLPYYMKYGEMFLTELKLHLDVMELQFTILQEE